MKLTIEQEEIINTLNKKNESIQINAFAGTGKTTTLRQIAEIFKDKKILYLVFNKSMEQEVNSAYGKNFPDNCDVFTIHGFAKKTLEGFNHKINNIQNQDFLARLGRFLQGKKPQKVTSKEIKSFKEELNEFCFSDAEHSKNNLINDFLMQTFSNQIPHSHNTYLKMFHIALKEKQILFPKNRYDIFMLDEVQDSNQVTLAIVELLNIPKKIFVGDTYQRIYSFRGANKINPLESSNAKKYYLTRSFRLSQNLAKKASRFLKIFHGEEKDLVGQDFKQPKIKTKAILARNNFTISNIIKELASRNNFDFQLTERAEGYFRLHQEILKIAQNLEQTKRVSSALEYYFRKYKKIANNNYSSNDFIDFLIENSKVMGELEVTTAGKIVKEFGHEIKNWIYKIENNQTENPSLTLSTIHKAKGKEWDEVILESDIFLPKIIANFFVKYLEEKSLTAENIKKDFVGFLVANRSNINPTIIDELNLYYVAITRAKYKLTDRNNFLNIFDLDNMSDIREYINQEIYKNYIDLIKN